MVFLCELGFDCDDQKVRSKGFGVIFEKRSKIKSLTLSVNKGVWLIMLGALIFLIFLDRDWLTLFSQ